MSTEASWDDMAAEDAAAWLAKHADAPPGQITIRKPVDLKAAVLAYLDEHPPTETFDPYAHYDAPVFRRHWDAATGKSWVEHVEGRPNVTAVSLELLDVASDSTAAGELGWDGECLTMPGDLRYRPVGFDGHGRYVVCERVGP